MNSFKRKSVLATYAFFLEFHRTIPLIFIMIHYTIIASWLGELDCEETPLNSFIIYWIFMIIFSFGWGFVIHLPIKVAGQKLTYKVLFSLWSGLLSAGIFTTWSFIRAKPFKCYVDGTLLTYVTAPPLFWIVHIIAIVTAALFTRLVGPKKWQQMVELEEESLVH